MTRTLASIALTSCLLSGALSSAPARANECNRGRLARESITFRPLTSIQIDNGGVRTGRFGRLALPISCTDPTGKDCSSVTTCVPGATFRLDGAWLKRGDEENSLSGALISRLSQECQAAVNRWKVKHPNLTRRVTGFGIHPQLPYRLVRKVFAAKASATDCGASEGGFDGLFRIWSDVRWWRSSRENKVIMSRVRIGSRIPPGALTLRITPQGYTLSLGDEEMVLPRNATGLLDRDRLQTRLIYFQRHYGDLHVHLAPEPAIPWSNIHETLESIALGWLPLYVTQGENVKKRLADAEDNPPKRGLATALSLAL